MTAPQTPAVAICMGSSCFARGNEKNLAMIESFLAERGLVDSVELTGLRCLGECSDGPNIRICGTLYHAVDAGTLMDLLEEHLIEKRAEQP